MVNEIISGVCEKLREEFGEDGYDYYTEIPMGDKSRGENPCFFVTCKNPKSGAVKDRYFTSRQLLGNRYLRRVGLCVEYRPAVTRVKPASLRGDVAPREECALVLDRLFECLEYVEPHPPFNEGEPRSGNVQMVRGGDMQGEIASDDILNFFVNYDVFMYYDEECEVMEKIEIKL